VAKNDRGRVSDGLTLSHMMLQLQRTSERDQALQQFIKDIHDPTSPVFHHWITAAEFGQRYGAAPADVARVTAWLQSQGFTVNTVYPNQMVIDFTGSAGQICRAFRTEIHKLHVNGQDHIANMSDPQIPVELAATVSGVLALHDFQPQPIAKARNSYTLGPYDYPIVPADLWTIYNFKPAFAAGNSGKGQTIVVLEQTDVYSTADWETFRSALGLASAYPQGSLTQIHPPGPPGSPMDNCTDPGVNAGEVEAAIDVEWATAAAPSAAIELASCAEGPLLALQNLLNASGTPPAIVSISLAGSEPASGAANNAYYNSLYQQGVTEGVSIFVSAGDWGPDTSEMGPYAKSGINVNALASTPYNVAVGGTDFADMYEGNASTYWGSVNAADYGSAVSYIPEIPWNNSCGSVLLADYLGLLSTYGSNGLCNDASQSMARLNIQAGGGGPSGCATGAPDIIGVVGGTCAGYAKPSWQSGLVGNPNDGMRDIPDVSLFSSSALGGHSYVLCFADPNNYGTSCNGTPDTWEGAGGTSVTAPIMAGIQALVNQASGSRWGNPNPAYYALAAKEYGSSGNTACNSALGNKVASDCIFYDVNHISLLYGGNGTGGDIDLPCSGENCYKPSGTYGVLSTARQSLTSVSVTNPGSGYTSLPFCTLSGGGGSGATCSTSTTGVVSSVALTNGGSGYTSIPNCNLTGGGGVGATCGMMSISPSGGALIAIAVVVPGSGYTSSPSCTISGGGGTGATCTATLGAGFMVSITAPGSGYATMPRCVLSGGGGTGATCAALAENTSGDYQPAFSAGPGWDFATGIGTVNVSNLVASFLSGGVATLSASSLTFPPQLLSTSSAAQTVTMTNPGPGILIISTTTIVGTNASDFAKSADTCSGATVVPNGTCTVSVTFTPSATGSRSASLSIADNAANSPQTVTLSGTGTGPVVSLSSQLTFSAQLVGTTSSSQTVTVTNTGSANLTLTAIGITGPFAVASAGSTCSITTPVAAGATCTVEVTFTPTSAGSAAGSISFTDNAPGSPQTLALSGTGQDFTLAPPSGSSTSAMVTRGQAATYTLSVGGQGGLSGTVNFTCSGAPSEATCTVSPNPLTAGSSATNVTVTVTTTAATLNAPRSRSLPPVPPRSPGLRGLSMFALILAMTAWVIDRRSQTGSRWRSIMLPLAVGLWLVLGLVGCGGGGGGGGGGGTPHDPGTPSGTYTLTVTGTTSSGSNAVSHSTTLTLNVS
jgi:hypothetical protein